jgi:hypothetical protein
MSAQRGTENRQPARMPSWLEPVAGEELVDETTMDGVEVSGPAPDKSAGVELCESRWCGGRLTGARLTRLRCADTVFEDCDLSGTLIEECGLRRVEFHRCRMSGVVLAGSALRDVLFTECRMDMANLRMAEGTYCTKPIGTNPNRKYPDVQVRRL